MSDDSSEPKKYPPSEKKLRDLRKKGQFPKTELAQPTIEIIAFFLSFYMLFSVLVENADNWIEVVIFSDLKVGYDMFYNILMMGIFSLLGVKLLVFVIEWVLVNKSFISTEQLGFKLDKLNPVNGVKNIFGLEAISKAFRKIVELLFLLFLLKYMIDVAGVELSSVAEINNEPSFYEKMFFFIAAISIFYFSYGFLLGCIDYTIERYHFMKKNMMTFTEMKNEMKETEGSPEVKSERKRIMRELADEPITKNRKPDFALANPDHILVPIVYDRARDKAPIVLKILIDNLAMNQREKLQAMEIPVIIHKELARKFYFSMKKGEAYVPKEFYKDVATIMIILKKRKMLLEKQKKMNEKLAKMGKAPPDQGGGDGAATAEPSGNAQTKPDESGGNASAEKEKS